MNAESLREIVNKAAEQAQLKVADIQVGIDDELGMPFPDVHVDVVLNKDPNMIYANADLMRIILNDRLKQDLRIGYYSKAIGYDDIPEGCARIVVDCWDLTLEPVAAPHL